MERGGCSTFTAALALLLTSNSVNAGFLDDVSKSVHKVIKVIPKVANPIQAQIDIVRGKKKPDEAIKDFLDGQVKAIATISEETRTLTGAADEAFENLAAAIGGDTGRIIYQMTFVGQRLQREFVFSGSASTSAILQGQDPLIAVTWPLAAAIRDARSKHIAASKPIPMKLRKLLEFMFPPHVLDRTRYTVGDLRISLPTLINQSSAFMGSGTAVVVDDVIVFPTEPDLDDLNDLEWWAHEIHHVAQYASWGVDLFAYRYAKNHYRVEGEAVSAGAYVRDFLEQLADGSSLDPKVQLGGAKALRPVTIDTPAGSATVYRPQNPSLANVSTDGVLLNNRCIVFGEHLVIDQNNRVRSVEFGGQTVGFRIPTANPWFCEYDLLSNVTGRRYCVGGQDGSVYVGYPEPIGRCGRCIDIGCL